MLACKTYPHVFYVAVTGLLVTSFAADAPEPTACAPGEIGKASCSPLPKEQVLLQLNHARQSARTVSQKNVTTSCQASQVQRRRRNDQMCSCRRRSGGTSGWDCNGNSLVPATTTTTTPCVTCIGWSPTSATKGTGKWCEVGVPADNWLALKTCPNGASSIPVKVLTYNLFWWNLFERRGGGDAGRLIADTSSPGEYDLIGFQECKNVDWVMGDAKSHGLQGEYGTLSHVWEDRALGMAYLKSRWSLLNSGKEDVGEDRSFQYYGKRAVQWARLQHNDGSVVFFINHHGPLPVSASGSCAGSATAYNIIRVIAENAHTDDVVMLVGDFNAQPHSSRFTTLSKYMHQIISGTSMEGVDHIFSNCNGPAVVDTFNLGNGGSDHDALSVVFSIPAVAPVSALMQLNGTKALPVVSQIANA